MLYVKYEEYKNKFHDAQETFDSILSEKEKLFSKTQPKSTDYSKDKTSSSVTPENNPFDTYVIKMQEKQVDERLNQARSILEDRKILLYSKEEELRHSKDWFDVVYKYYFLEKLSIRQIAKRIPHSTTSIFEKIKIIKENINSEQKRTKVIVK